MKRALSILGVAVILLAGCNQPFEPNGPVSSNLVVYCILSARSDTQYVRVSSTFGTPPAPEIRDASVSLIAAGRSIAFRDTTVLWSDTSGNPVPTNVYVAYNTKITGNYPYQLLVTTPGGLEASAGITTLSSPYFSLAPGNTQGFFVLNRKFNSVAGAAVLHFYLDYYVLVNNGWVLRTEEVPTGSYDDASGNEVLLYPSFSPVAVLASGGMTVSIDSTLFQVSRARVLKRYAPAPVVYLDIRFVLTQIDDVLYDYYYLTNGPVDNSSIRLDVPDFTNIHGGFGVFGSRSDNILLFPLQR